MYYIKVIFRWIRRIAYCRGFGVQSPSAYSFIRYVINEHYPYYAFDELNEKHKVAGKLACKLGRLYFRIANHHQSDKWYYYGDNEKVVADYVQAGYRKCVVEQIKEVPESYDVASVKLDAYSKEHLLSRLLDVANDESLLVIENIHDKENYDVWKKLLGDSKVSVCYDLYYCGIVFFDKSKYKRCYKVNF